MPSSSRPGVVAFIVLLALSGRTSAQQQPQGFAVERLDRSGPGGGWFVMDDLDIHGGLGGVIGLTLGYASNPLRVTDGVNRIAVVSDQAFADVGAAITYRRWRFYLNIDTPLVVAGQTGTVGDYSFTGPALNPASNPDVLSDARVGTDVRIVGRPGGHFRFGASAQLLIPFGERIDYVTDATFRGMLRALFAGDARYFTYAAQLGVHIRPLDDSPAPGSPQGSELLFGVAAGAKLRVGRSATWVAIVGPEIYGATAFRAFFSANGTAVEGLLSGRLETTHSSRPNVRVKLGIGAGLNHHFGAAEWRLVAGVELFGQHRP
ncbi:MAG: outer membrane protein OmpA [bacterium]|nr:outer membrane protein OmpA [bacterium]